VPRSKFARERKLAWSRTAQIRASSSAMRSCDGSMLPKEADEVKDQSMGTSWVATCRRKKEFGGNVPTQERVWWQRADARKSLVATCRRKKEFGGNVPTQERVWWQRADGRVGWQRADGRTSLVATCRRTDEFDGNVPTNEMRMRDVRRSGEGVGSGKSTRWT